jgi:hypothetical protein
MVATPLAECEQLLADGKGLLLSGKRQRGSSPLLNRFAIAPLALLFAAATAGAGPADREPDDLVPASNPLRRALVQIDLVAPVNDEFGASKSLGYGGSLGYWLEMPSAAIHPRLGIHYGPGSASSYYLDVVGDLGASWLVLKGPITPILGGGVGFRFLRVRGKSTESSLGSVLMETTDYHRADNSLGFSSYLRTGVLLFRDSQVNLAVNVDYILTVLSDSRPQAVLLSMGVVF